MSAPARRSPQLDYWTYADLAAELGLSVKWVKHNMRAWEADGFPAPAPWWRREKRWRADAVRAWFDRQERRAGALPPGGFRPQIVANE